MKSTRVAALWIIGVGLLHCTIEPQAVHPFAGPRDFVRRLYVEQFCNFWRFLFRGGWFASLKASQQKG